LLSFASVTPEEVENEKLENRWLAAGKIPGQK
jgi:hypothetical protein